MRRARKIALWSIGGAALLFMLLVGGSALLFVYGPSSGVKSVLAAAIEKATGRRIEIDGPLTRGLWPDVRISAGAVRVFAPGQTAGAAPVAAEGVAVKARFWPLLSGRLELTEVSLKNAKIDAERLGAAARAPSTTTAPGTAKAATPSDASTGFDLRRLAAYARGDGPAHIEMLSAVGGAVLFRDKTTGKPVEINIDTISYAAPKDGDSATLSATGALGGAPIRLTADLMGLAAAARGEAGKIKGRFEGAGVRLSFEGDASLGDGTPQSMRLEGATSIFVSNDRAATGWLRAFLPAALSPLEAIEARGRITVDARRLDIDFSGAATFRGQRTAAQLSVEAGEGWLTGATAATVKAALKNPHLDAGYEGRFGYTTAGGLLLDGAYRLKAADVRALSRWATGSDDTPLFKSAPKLESVDVTGAATLVADRAVVTSRGAIGYNGVPARFDLGALGGKDWRSGGATDIRLTARADGLFSLRWDGRLEVNELRSSVAPTFAALDGDIQANVFNVARFRTWLDLPPSAGKVGDIAFDGRFRAVAPKPPVVAEDVALERVVQKTLREVVAGETPKAETPKLERVSTKGWDGASIELTKFQFRANGVATNVEGRADVSVDKLTVVSQLTGGPLDLTPWTEAALSFGALEKPGGASLASLSLDAPNMGAVGWSATPFDLSALGMIDADIKLDLKGLKVGGFQLGATKGTIRAQDRRLEISTSALKLFGGDAEFSARLDASSSAAPAAAAALKLRGGELRELFEAAGAPSTMVGKFDAAFDLKAVGASEAALAKSVAGSADFSSTNGAIFWIDFKTLSGAGAAEFLGLRQIVKGVTFYDRIKGTVKIADGVARNRDLELAGDFISFRGGGRIDVGARQMKYVVLITKFGEVSILPIDEIIGRAVPIVIRGAWESLQFGTEKGARPETAAAE
ncbi:MAG: AsmA family protein [Neomegalonema sp.]|nr:AsmA family protein [Neomegalonema sp.]